MQWLDRQGNVVPGDDGQDRLLETLYGNVWGRALVWVMIRPWVSHAAGVLLDSPLSAAAVKPFIRKNRIDMTDYEDRKFRSFNDFFTRRIAPGKREFDMVPEHLTAPCDSKLTVWEIGPDSRFRIKNTDYTLASLLRSEELAEHYRGGTLLLFRLTVGDYHRYSFPDSGRVGSGVKLKGVYHTVNPAANDRYPIYKENTREYTILESDHFGRVLQMEVGAAMVGRIKNHPCQERVNRGQEKGMFEFGGSTVILLLEKGRIQMDADLIRNTDEGFETVVKLGQKIGIAQGKEEMH